MPKAKSQPLVSFGIIALNALPFLEYNLNSLYPFAHEIFVVEGATHAAASLAGKDGHSVDGTLQMLDRFKREVDSQHKLHIITAEQLGRPNGFWEEKDEMSRVYAERSTGNWLWQVDSDEFYLPGDMRAVIDLLERQPQMGGVSFPYIEFFGSFNSFITGTWHLYEHPRFSRLFRWGPGYTYSSHRPPTVLDEKGRDLKNENWLNNPLNQGEPVYLHHYSYVLPKQAVQKVGYYSNVNWTDAFRDNKNWYENQYLRLKKPFRLGERGGLQWLERFKGTHPDAIGELQADLAAGHISEALRPTDDIERLLSSRLYAVETALARAFLAVFWPLRTFWKRIRAIIFPAQAI